jgi:hypothetical protein
MTRRIKCLEQTTKVLHIPFDCLFPISTAATDVKSNVSVNMTADHLKIDWSLFPNVMYSISDSEQKSNTVGEL